MTNNSKYKDITSIVNVIGNIYNNPNLLEQTDKYFFNEDDFPSEFHQIVFGSIYNLYQLGAKTITVSAIEDYLTTRPKKLGVYKANGGDKYILQCAENSSITTFDYYYNRMKKMTLLRETQHITGMNLDWLYNPDEILNLKKKQKQEDWLDNASLTDIYNKINDKIESIKEKYVDDTTNVGCSIGEGIDQMLADLKAHPEIGYPLFGKYINTVTSGARLKKFYLRSAATGVGKTRSMIADACFIGCSQIFDLTDNIWITTGAPENVLYIATEQDLAEIQTMCLAFISGVDEDHIIKNDYLQGEIERVEKAAILLKRSHIYFEALPDFSLQDIENTIKRNIREREVKYIFHDYLHTSMKVLEEITKRSGGVKLREDNILFMISIRLKDICNQYGVFIMSATQLNGDYKDADIFDQNLLRGAKSIADKIDWGAIMLEATKEDLEKLEPIIRGNGFETPQVKISIYKNRRGRWKNVLLWCRANRGICRIEPIFITNYSFELQNIEDLKIKVAEASAF